MNNIQDLAADPLSGSGKGFDFKLYASKVKSNWYWFLLSFLICLVIAFVYVRYATPIYNTTASVLIKEDESSSSGESGLLKAIGGDLAPVNSTETEAEIFKTRLLMEDVVKSLKANIVYFANGKFNNVEISETPFRIKLLGMPNPKASAVMDVKIKGDKILLSNETFNKTVSFYEVVAVKGLGNIQIEKGEIASDPNLIYSFKVAPVRAVVESFLSRLTVAIPSKQVNIIQLSFSSPLPQKSEAVLNSLIESYIKNNILDKNTIADSTINFINERLSSVGDELSNVEGKVESFKKTNNVTDIAAQSAQLITSKSESAVNLAAVETQLDVATSLEKYLSDAGTTARVVPSGALLNDPGFSALVDKYNSTVLDKERSKLSQTEANPYVQNLNSQIAGLRSDMMNSLASLKKNLTISRSTIQNTANRFQGEVKSVPGKERTFLDLARQQQIKQELYIFLLQKKEQTAISKTSNISNCKIIELPISNGPVSPNRKMIMIYGGLFGLLIPLGIMYLADLMNNKVQMKEDVSSRTHIPVIAEVGKSNSLETIIVSSDSRTPISEQFRNLRTNLSFFMKEGEKKILVTSSMSGEGKSFCSINLAAILALTGKKVVIMEMDLRKPNLSNKFNLANNIGYTNYITSKETPSSKIIRPSGLLDNLFIISSGPIPPNPAELLIDDRINDLMAELERDFDYIIMDAPPVGLVTDAQLLSNHADLTLYVVRQDYTFKEQIAIPEDIFINKKIKNIAILLNDAKFNTSYGYGYGYGNDEDKEESSGLRGFFKKK